MPSTLFPDYRPGYALTAEDLNRLTQIAEAAANNFGAGNGSVGVDIGEAGATIKDYRLNYAVILITGAFSGNYANGAWQYPSGYPYTLICTVGGQSGHDLPDGLGITGLNAFEMNGNQNLWAGTPFYALAVPTIDAKEMRFVVSAVPKYAGSGYLGDYSPVSPVANTWYLIQATGPLPYGTYLFTLDIPYTYNSGGTGDSVIAGLFGSSDGINFDFPGPSTPYPATTSVIAVETSGGTTIQNVGHFSVLYPVQAPYNYVGLKYLFQGTPVSFESIAFGVLPVFTTIQVA